MSFTPVYFVTVDTSTKKAKRTFGTVVKDLSSSHDLTHIANCKTIRSVKTVLESLVTAPKLLIASSDWFEEEQEEIREIAQRIIPGILLIMVPPGLFKQEGEKKCVEYLVEQVGESRLPTKG